MSQRITTQKIFYQGCSKPGLSIRLGLKICFLATVMLNSACSTINTSANSNWNISNSSIGTAFKDPKTWIPATAAIALVVTDTDKKISNWATKHHPIYGAQDTAQDASDFLRTVLASSAVITSVAAPPEPDILLPGRFGSLTTAALTAATTSKITGALKDSTKRTRPNEVDTRSFPSSHTAAASTYATLSSQRVAQMPFSLKTREAIQTGFHILAGATGWARVEAHAHYPVDVLTGFALGNFIAVMLDEILQKPKHPVWVGLNHDRNNDIFTMQLGVQF